MKMPSPIVLCLVVPVGISSDHLIMLFSDPCLNALASICGITPSYESQNYTKSVDDVKYL